MDNAMVKRGIGAVVLAIIAALLLGYLLKDKSRERQEVVEMKLPGTATDEKIPDLTATAENAGDTIVGNANQLTENVTNTDSTVIAAASGAGAAAVATVATKAAGNAKSIASDNQVTSQDGKPIKPGFSIRPAGANEQRDIVDVNGKNVQASTKSSTSGSASKSAPKSNDKRKNAVVASASSTPPKETYRPRLIKERKNHVITSAQGKSRAKAVKVSASKRVSASSRKQSKKATTTRKAASGKGSYAIQLMATSSQSRAKKLASTMKKEGYVSYITQTTRASKVLYRVRVRTNGSRKSAIAAQQKMKRRYRKNFFVQNSLVVSN